MERETKKEQPRRTSEERVWSGECIQEKAIKTEFCAKHRDATRRWREGKRINNDNETNHTPSESSKSTKIISRNSFSLSSFRGK